MAGIHDWLRCPECGSGRVEFTGQGYRENAVQCKSCGNRE